VNSLSLVSISFIISLAILIAGILVFTYSFTDQQAIAQVTNATDQNATQAAVNLTTSVNLSSEIIEYARSNLITLSDASERVTSYLGPSSLVYSALLDTENGYLIYEIVAVDSDNLAHLFVVDPRTGEIIIDRELGRLARPFS
jgi:uncharacterized protein YpmB